MEFYKEMTENNLKYIAELLNRWWQTERVPKEALQARVVSIHKKGDTNNMETYKPISLLNSIYKIHATIIQRRLAEKLDDRLQKTQFGFRK